jgi:hypothetical protein
MHAGKKIVSLLQNFRNHGSPLSRKYDAVLKLMLISGREGLSSDFKVITLYAWALIIPTLEWDIFLSSLPRNSLKR